MNENVLKPVGTPIHPYASNAHEGIPSTAPLHAFKLIRDLIQIFEPAARRTLVVL